MIHLPISFRMESHLGGAPSACDDGKREQLSTVLGSMPVAKDTLQSRMPAIATECDGGDDADTVVLVGSRSQRRKANQKERAVVKKNVANSEKSKPAASGAAGTEVQLSESKPAASGAETSCGDGLVDFEALEEEPASITFTRAELAALIAEAAAAGAAEIKGTIMERKGTILKQEATIEKQAATIEKLMGTIEALDGKNRTLASELERERTHGRVLHEYMVLVQGTMESLSAFKQDGVVKRLKNILIQAGCRLPD